MATIYYNGESNGKEMEGEMESEMETRVTEGYLGK